MSRDEFVDYLASHQCNVRKKRNNGMWIVYGEASNKLVAIPSTDPPRAGNMVRICETLQIPLPNVPKVQKVKIDLDEVRRRSNFGHN